MGAMLTALNERKLPLSETTLKSLLPARVLNLFVKELLAGKIDRTFAKPIFEELCGCDWDVAVELECEQCGGYGYAEVEVGLDPQCGVCFTGGVIRRPIDPEIILGDIIDDPRFKAADESVKERLQ
jgi:hypothetical protein